MSGTLLRIQRLASVGQVRISEHGFDELAADAISIAEVVGSIAGAVAVEDYPESRRGPSVLALQQDATGRPIHVVWGVRKGQDGPAVLFTAYRPDPRRWTVDYRERLE